MQINEKEELHIKAQEAIDTGIISSEMLTYQLYLARKFLNELGIPNEMLRFRQHLPGEMAHYALDCWDVECLTDQYGWVEIIGIADRGNYDLTQHGKESNEELSIYIPYDEPKTITKNTVKPNLKVFGPTFKGDAPKIMGWLKNCDANELKEKIDADGKYTLELDNTYELTSEHLLFEETTEEVKGEKLIPHVIEPSFGIDRILYCVLLHSFHSANKEDEEDKDYFKFQNEIAPIQVSVLPLVNKKGLDIIASEIQENLRNNGFTVDYDGSGSIGRRYARADEIGIPVAITVDFDTKEDNTVTVRNRDTEEQERVPITDLSKVINSIIKQN